MEQATLTALLNFLSHTDAGLLLKIFALLIGTPFGVVILIFVFWAINERKRSEMLRLYREDMHQVLESYGKDIAKLSLFYEHNVILVQNWEKIGNGFQDQVVLNTQTMQRMIDVCVTNQFCPHSRLPK